MRKIEFFNIVQGVADAYPIIKSSEYKPTWVSVCKQKYEEKKVKMDGDKFFHTYRCPGIFDLMGQGYMVTCPWDVTIETNGDGEDFRWRVPAPDIATMLGDDPIQGHMSNAIADTLPVKQGRLRSIIKFTTGWNMIAPPGVKFIIIPLPYPDTFEFESATGILDPGISTELNAQLYWNVINGRHTVKAGTPLCQVIPLTDERFEIVVRNATPDDYNWMAKRRYFLNMHFSSKRGMFKELYNRIFKRD